MGRPKRDILERIDHAAALSYTPSISEKDEKTLEDSLLSSFSKKLEKLQKQNEEERIKREEEEKKKEERKKATQEAATKRFLKILLEDGEESAAELSRKATTVMNNVTSLQHLIDLHSLQEKKLKENKIEHWHYVALSKKRVKNFEEIVPLDYRFRKLDLWRVQELIYMNNALPRMIFEVLNYKGGTLNIFELSTLFKMLPNNLYHLLKKMIEIGLIVKTYAFQTKQSVSEYREDLNKALDKENYEEITCDNLPYVRVAYFSINEEFVDILNWLHNRLYRCSQVSKRIKITTPGNKLELWQTKRKKILAKQEAQKIKKITEIK